MLTSKFNGYVIVFPLKKAHTDRVREFKKIFAQIERRKSQPKKGKPKEEKKKKTKWPNEVETVEREAITIHCSGLYLKSHLLFISP